MNTKKLVTLSFFTAVSLAVYCAEAALPPPLPIPGVKLGLSNIFTLLLLLNYTGKDALTVLILRIFLGSIFAGQAVSFLYSLAGGLFCFLIMLILNRLLNKKYFILTSIFGALFHNIGQLIVAALLSSSTSVFLYLPYLIISAALTGLFTGLCAHYIRRTLKHFHNKTFP